jgi:hypothetical protein
MARAACGASVRCWRVRCVAGKELPDDMIEQAVSGTRVDYGATCGPTARPEGAPPRTARLAQPSGEDMTGGRF